MSQPTITPWQINIAQTVQKLNVAGDRQKAVEQGAVPGEEDPGWKPWAVGPNGKYSFDLPSILSTAGQELHFSYMQTTVTVPAGYDVQTFNVTFGHVDDGARVFIFNDQHADGSPTNLLYGDQVKTADLKGSVAVGENRVVVAQFDWGGKNKIDGLALEVNGTPLTVSALGPKIGARTSFRSVNFPDRHIRHSGFQGKLDPISSELDMKDSTFTVRAGLQGPREDGRKTVSFESVNYVGYFLVAQGDLVNLVEITPDSDSGLRVGATFMVRQAPNDPGAVNFTNPDADDDPTNNSYVRHEHFRIKFAPHYNSELFRSDSAFVCADPFWTA